MPEPRAERMRLGVLLTSAMASSTMMQFTIGALGPAIRADLDLSRAALGGLTAVYYFVAAVLSRPVGRRIDSMPARLALAAVFVGTGLAMAAAALAGSYVLLLAAVLPAGVAAAAGNPVTNRVIAHLPMAHGTLIAVKQSGVPLGTLGAGAVLPVLAVAIGWRGAVACLAVVCLAAVALTAWTPTLDAGRPDDSPARWKPASGGVGAIAVYAFFMGAGMSTLTAYLPLYGHDRLGFSQAAAGGLLALIGAGGVVARVCWVRLHERRAGGGAGSVDVLVGLAAAALVATVMVAVAQGAGSWLLWLAAGMLGLTAVAWNALAMLAVLERTPASSTAATSGSVLTAFYLGLCVAAPLFGVIVDATGGYAAGWCMTAASFGLAAVTVRRAAP